MNPPRKDAYNNYSIAVYNVLKQNNAGASALVASYVSTFIGYPLDSVKSRLQARKTPVSVPQLTRIIYREEGAIGFFRGLWIPLSTVALARAAVFTIYSQSETQLSKHGLFTRDTVADVAATAAIGGAISAALTSPPLAPVELLKVRRQLEYMIAAKKGIQLYKPPGTMDAFREIIRDYGVAGLYIGFRLQLMRDVFGTALYFAKYDTMRYICGRNRSGEQGPLPAWLPVHPSMVPFLCGSFAGVVSWGLIYPFDLIKTKVQQKALSGEPTPAWKTFKRLFRGTDPNAPKSITAGLGRIYRGIGLSSLRGIMIHGLLWTFYDISSNFINDLPTSSPRS
ncbi:mitochondrial carrier [Infundibulicybe gibba]|nr:mitochondrial carrier [Infundibulicybe gibba]